MNGDEFIALVKNKKGQFLPLKWKRKVPTSSKYKDIVLEKETSAIIRTGITYDNISNVKEKRENGELPAENAGLPWGAWKHFPYVIENKGKEYARLYPDPLERSKVTWYVNGTPINPEIALNYLTPSDKKKECSDEKECFVVEMKNFIIE